MVEDSSVSAASAPALFHGSREAYRFQDGLIVHELSVGSLRVDAAMAITTSREDPKGAWWLSYLMGVRPVAARPASGKLHSVDLFCGLGGLANGLRQLCAEIGVTVVPDLVVDQDEEATFVYAANHSSRRRSSSSVNKLIDFCIRRSSKATTFVYRPEIVDSELARVLDRVQLVLAGPPCQGHSNLNNRTRRADPRNSLYLTVPAFAVAVGAPMCIIENVPAILNDSEQVVQTAQLLFESEGYSVTTGMLSASAMGWPQTRRRHFLVARRDRAPIPLPVISEILRDDPRSLWWAIGELEDVVGGDFMHERTELSEENQVRIDWLFDNDQYELALHERPESHRGGTSYTAVYGRLRKDEPAPTITTGFMTPGRGRYTHPTRRRVLTAREAARLQGLPDTYTLAPDPANPPFRSQLAKWIGDAVPMPLGYAAALSALGNGLPDT